MKVTAEATDVITTIDGQPARIWRATTENGVPCMLFVSMIAVDRDADVSQFEAELQSVPAPRELQARDAMAAIDMRLVL